MSDILSMHMEDTLGVIPMLHRLARKAPKACERAQLRAASIMPRKILAAMRTLNLKDAGGKLPGLSEVSLAMRTRKPGGKLTAERGLCRVMNVNGKLVAGFVGRVENVAALWQEGGTKPIHPHVRRMMHIVMSKHGARGVIVPTVAEQPQRLVVEPLAKSFGREMPRWILGALEKEIDKNIGKARK